MGVDKTSECGIEISVSTRYLQQKSDMLRSTYAFTYTITIRNNRPDTVQLLNRHWIITDQNNHIEEVKGKGVIGQQPILKPGSSFQYTSGTVIASEVGDMRGSYTMKAEDGKLFEAPIPLFILANPKMFH